MSATSAAAHAGMILVGRYRLDSPIASGGMAQVWRGQDLSLDRAVAIKILHPHLAGDDGFVLRFRREAVASARLSHPSIVAVYDTVSQPGVEAIVMELIEGRTLRSVLDEVGVLPPADVVDIGIQISQALDAAHSAGIVHRDIKPANIMIGTDRRILVADFGIAKATQDDDLTSTGTLLGTAKYLAPEQVTGEPVDPRADLYALGVVLFEAATGQAPFVAETDAATALARLREEVPRCRQRRPETPPDLDNAIARAMARNPDDRFDRATSLQAALSGANLTPGPSAPITSGPGTAGPPPVGQPLGPGFAPPPPTPTPTPSPAPLPTPGPAPAMGPATAPMGQPAPSTARPPTPGPSPSTNSGGGRRATPPTTPPTKPADAANRSTGRVRLMAAVLIIAGLAVLGLLVIPGVGGDQDEPTGEPLDLVGATSFDPQGTPPHTELEALSGLAIDGDPETHWQTEGYFRPSLGNLKDGVGLIVELDQVANLGSIMVTSESDGWTMEVYVGEEFGPNGPDFELDDLGQPAAVLEGGDQASASLGGAEGSRVLLWVTEAGNPEEDGKHRFRLNEVVIR